MSFQRQDSGCKLNRCNLSALSLSAHSTGHGSCRSFGMHDVDISKSYGHGTVPIKGRESHTADLDEFDRYVKILETADRLDLPWETTTEGDEEAAEEKKAATAEDILDVPIGMNIDMNEVVNKLDDLEFNEAGGESKKEDVPQDSCDQSQKRKQYSFNPKIWAYIRSILSNAKPVGFNELPDPKATSVKGPDDASNFLSKVIAVGPLNPIQPAIIAKEGGFDEDEVLAELFYGTLVGLVAMRFSPECIQCGSAVMDTDILGRIPGEALCGGCNAPNVIESLDKIKVMFLLNSDVLYVLAENYACTPSAESLSVTSVFAAIPANSTGSGYSYRIGTGEDEIAPALEPGKFRMHCPVAKTDNYLVVGREATDEDKAVELRMKVSDLVHNHKSGQKKKVLNVPHGKIQFDIFPDSRSFFVLWVQRDVDDKKLMYLPEEERAVFTSAAKVIHHPTFNALFEHSQVVAVQRNVSLSISNVVLVFTDIVDSTKLFASLGDGPAFGLVRKHFQVLFGAFTRNGGRVVKTIGDAVMASFTNGRAALTAVSEAMNLLPTIGRRPDNDNFVEIRVGIHSGQVTVVPLNGINDYFGQNVNIAARVQSAAKASECFVTETVLDTEDAREAYDDIVKLGSSFKSTPVTELRLKGVSSKVQARGFRWILRSRRESEVSSDFMDRKVNRTYSARISAESPDSSDAEDEVPTKQFERPAETGRRLSKLDAHDEELE